MAVNIGSKQSTTQTQQVQQNNTQQSAIGFNMNMFGISNPLAAFGSGGETYEKLYEAIQKIVKNLNEDSKSNIKFAVHKLLKQVAGLNYSGIILSEYTDQLATSHILMIEKTGDYPDKIIENIAGVRYEIVRTPADALDDKYVAQAQKLVADSLKMSTDNVVIVDGTLVPNEFDVTSESQILALVNNTINSVHSEINLRLNDYKGINIANILSSVRTGKFYINLYFNQDESNFFDQTGMPVRQDICVALSFKNTNVQNNRSVNQGNDTIDIVKTYGYIDFEWSPSIINGVMTTQKFIPNFIITHIDSHFSPTPDILMLSVASVLAINEDMSWMQAFRPSPVKKNEIDYNDIGALNIEGNIENNQTGFGKKYDTKSKSFSILELNKLIQTLVRPNIMISIDLPKAGPETWFTSVLHYIKFRNSKEAYTRLVEHINNLTNNVFQNVNVPVFTDISNKIHGGYYKTKDGIKDLRHLSSYLSVANFINDTNQQPQLITQYTNTLYNVAIPTELRTAERKKFIDEMSNKTAVIKMYHDRVTFNAVFLLNLVNALKTAGFAPIFSNLGSVNDMFARRSTVDFTSGLLGGDARILGAQNLYSNFNMPYGYTRTF